MIRRKDTFGYIDFIRGKYSPYNIEQLQHTINEMSETEKERIKTESFENLWKHMWGGTGGTQFRNEETISAKKFDIISKGVTIDEKTYTLLDLLNKSNTDWKETEWNFQKEEETHKKKI